MIKKVNFIPILLLLMILLVSCVPKPVPAPAPVPVPDIEIVEAPQIVPTTGDKSVDEVGTDISDASDLDDELDTAELDDVDIILADIENI